MATQYEKRKQKSVTDVVKEVEAKRDDIRSKATFEPREEPVYTQKGYDVFSPDGGRTFKVAELEYNPETGDARVVGTSDITRLVALKYDAQKTALGILKKGK